MINKLLCLIYLYSSIYSLDFQVQTEALTSVLDESPDERHDAEIFRAVFESMKQWELHKKRSMRKKRETSRVCYENVGCFEDTGPFSYLEMLPSPPKDVGTRFYVYGSRKARSVPMEVSADDVANDVANNAIDPQLPTKIIVHGFGSDCDNVWVYEMRSALMSVHDCNIVCVDWSPGSAIPNYVRAAANTRLVGRQLAQFVRGLNVSLDMVHMIGFSLGAHVAGFAGSELFNVSRITGLDPAGPLFETQDPQVRLDNMDAHFVDVIHSNGEQLILGGLGSWQPMGDVDFYPNGGRMQTGCSNLFLGAVSDFIWSSSIEGRSLCNHRRAYKFFTDSVSPKCRFPAFPCEKGYNGFLQGECFPCGPGRLCGDMGYYSDTSNARGQLYLITREEEPFCALQYQIKVYNSHGKRPTKSYGKLQVTLIGSGSFNETFTMTRKDDEELLVGTILHKIVVPHPVIVNLKAVEVKYTAYSGWISSGLVSWDIDKISVLDSFGKSISVCKKSLSLESENSVYLLLYPGECNIPIELDYTSNNHSLSSTTLTNPQEDLIDKTFNEKVDSHNIGPFVKNQNFESENKFSVQMLSDENNFPQTNMGPFTKNQNLKMTLIDKTNQFSQSENHKLIHQDTNKDNSKFWSSVIYDNRSNLLGSPLVEMGRGFSDAGYVISTSTTSSVPTDSTPSINFISEIHEPVLKVNKHETGRSMRLPEVTEPLLRPRIIRQNIEKSEVPEKKVENSNSDAESKKETNKGFTVQLLPEKLANILEQAEKYARRTFLPLISQYTPSFIDERGEKLKYFPSLTNISEDNSSSESHIISTTLLPIKDNYKDSQDIKIIDAVNRSKKNINLELFEKTVNNKIISSKFELSEVLGNTTNKNSGLNIDETRDLDKSIDQSNNWVPISRNLFDGRSIRTNTDNLPLLENPVKILKSYSKSSFDNSTSNNSINNYTNNNSNNNVNNNN
ncbi:GSCOCG00009934001-RA-CDS, partial [Cotesia congregata]